METKTARIMTQNIKDIERAAWYARLAFGIYPESEDQLPAAPEKHKPAFNVIP